MNIERPETYRASDDGANRATAQGPTPSCVAFLLLSLIFSLVSIGCESSAESRSEAPESSASDVESPSGHDEPEGHVDVSEEAGDHDAEHHAHKITVTEVTRRDVIETRRFVCRIRSCRHIEVRALEGGYLEEICVREGEEVKQGELLFRILPTLYQARLNAEIAEAERLRIELTNAQSLLEKKVLSEQAVALKQAELAKAQAQVELAKAELGFAQVVAPFDGIVDRQMTQLGSLIEEGDVLTTLSDNSVMWVYFNVPEAQYLEYMAELKRQSDDEGELTIELKLANGELFPQPGEIGAIEADFDNRTGNIAFRADFPNPDRLLRNGQTGTILMHEPMRDVIVIPQRATFEVLAKQYVYVVDEQGVVRQRDITVRSEQDDIYVIEEGLEEGERIVLEGIRQVRDGDRIAFEFVEPETVFEQLKFHAE
ncbi:MAG TPA: efflux RND transporter periplasmic adaptor subunit [Planctomycetaceae bacterium]|nr:efflux RND transporter periplasmic adaptor subunit [Planctomycetaceae bacterium]HRF00249.1 efflux RND transporter periplasmic adaptor subunit [Pirellulaceae bacterium]